MDSPDKKQWGILHGKKMKEEMKEHGKTDKKKRSNRENNKLTYPWIVITIQEILFKHKYWFLCLNILHEIQTWSRLPKIQRLDNDSRKFSQLGELRQGF